MIKIRQLRESEWQKAMELKIECWTEELAGKAENRLELEKQLEFWTNWMYSAVDQNDIRVTLGAFEGGELLGMAGGSLAAKTDIPEKGMELDGLWVKAEHRNRGVSLRLLVYLLNYFSNFGLEKMVIYNHHYAPSTDFYKKFGAELLRRYVSTRNGENLEVDVFVIDMADFLNGLESTLVRY